MTEQANKLPNPKEVWKEKVQACQDETISVKQLSMATGKIISESKIYKDIQLGRFPGLVKLGKEGTKARIPITKESACFYIDEFHDTFDVEPANCKKKNGMPPNKSFNFEWYDQSNARCKS